MNRARPGHSRSVHRSESTPSSASIRRNEMSALELDSTCQADAEIQRVTTEVEKREVLVSRAWRHTGSWDEAEDVAQTVFANCWARRKHVPTTVGELTT